jgi:hypothetical protein
MGQVNDSKPELAVDHQFYLWMQPKNQSSARRDETRL